MRCASLALARGVTVRDYLASKGVKLERLFLGNAKTEGFGEDKDWTPHAEAQSGAALSADTPLNKGWAAGRQPFVFGHAAAELPDSDARVLGVLAKPGQNSTLDAG